MKLNAIGMTICALLLTLSGYFANASDAAQVRPVSCAGRYLVGIDLHEDGSRGWRTMCLPNYYFDFIGGQISDDANDVAACASENTILGTLAEGDFSRMKFVPLISKDQTQKVCAQLWFAVFIIDAK